MSLGYRQNVAAFILNFENKILTCQRADGHNDWQIPQGGVDPRETTEQTLKRELEEEVGLTNFEILSKLEHTITYDWPKELHSRGFKGQEQTFYVVKITDKMWEPNFNLHHQIEFKDYKWLNVSEFYTYTNGTFRGNSYKKALNEFIKKIPIS